MTIDATSSLDDVMKAQEWAATDTDIEAWYTTLPDDKEKTNTWKVGLSG